MRISDWSSDVCSSDLVLEAAVVEAEIILDRLVPRQAQPLGRGESFHQSPARFIRTAQNAHLALAYQFVERLHHRFIRCAMVGPVGLVEVDIDRKSTRLNSSH